MRLKKFKKFNESMEFENLDIVVQVLTKKKLQYKIDEDVLTVDGLEYKLSDYKGSDDLIVAILENT